MQISTASLLAAQQARVQSQPQVQRATAPKPPQTAVFEPASFEPMAFAAKPDAKPAAPPSAQPNAQAPFVRPGSQVDIRI